MAIIGLVHVAGGKGGWRGRGSKRLRVSIFKLVHFNVLCLVRLICASCVYAVFDNVGFQKYYYYDKEGNSKVVVCMGVIVGAIIILVGR